MKIAGEAAPRVYRGVVLANGHHHKPRMPVYPGQFAGEILHSSAYRTPRQLRDKRVLVVGAGNSACDIARDAAHASGSVVTMSFRRGYWFVPKFMLGFPTYDVVATAEMIPMPRCRPAFLVRGGSVAAAGAAVALQAARSRLSYRSGAPDDERRHSASCRRTAGSTISPEIERYEGRRVRFKDGTQRASSTSSYSHRIPDRVPVHRQTI